MCCGIDIKMQMHYLRYNLEKHEEVEVSGK